MKTPVIIVAIIIGLLVAFVGYGYLNQERTVGERLDSTTEQIGQGNLGEAVDEAGNATVGEKIQDDLNDAGNAITEPTPAPAAQ